MEYKDYYKILDLDRNAKEDEIRRAYRKLAQKYHPDHNPGDKSAEEKFKEINEAYQVLSDPQKRARYNQLGESYSRWQQRGAPSGGFNWEDWFTTSPSSSGYVQVDNLEDLMGGSFSEFFSRVFGGMPNIGGYPQNTRRSREKPSQQKPLEQPVTISLTEAYHGTTRKIEIGPRRMEVKIPPGVKNGLKIRMADAMEDMRRGHKQDLYLVVNIANDPRFERKGDDLHITVPVDLYTVVLGGEVTVQTLSGNVVLTIPPGTQSDQVFRLTGRGMPRLKEPVKFGDLFARIQVQIPRNLTDRQKDLFQQLARS